MVSVLILTMFTYFAYFYWRPTVDKLVTITTRKRLFLIFDTQNTPNT